MGPTLEARLYTLECSVRITFDVSRQLAKQGEACSLRRLLHPRARCSQGEVNLAYYSSLYIALLVPIVYYVKF